MSGDGFDKDRKQEGKPSSTIEYDRAKAMAVDPDTKVRRALASHADTQPEVLFFLAEDRDPTVRLEVAKNPNAPRQADILLIKDEDGAIRSGLAEKIAKLLPDMPNDERSRLYSLTVKALEALAEDSLAMVRKVLAECLKDTANAPHGVVRLLAEDAELSVSQPILEFSPVLSDGDLIEIINSKPIQGAMRAIARRDALGETVSDAIVAHGGDDDIAELLTNQSAQIREETLDILVERAEFKPMWHEPFVIRPALSRRAILRLSNFVAMNLLDRLQSRTDMDAATLAEVARSVEQRLEAETARAGRETRPSWAEDVGDVAQRVDRMAKAGGLRGSELESAMARGDKLFVVKAIAHLSKTPESAVVDAVESMNAAALVSLVWKTGLRPKLAQLVQSQLAGIPPNDILRGDLTNWPLDPDDMEWHISMLKGDGKASRPPRGSSRTPRQLSSPSAV